MQMRSSILAAVALALPFSVGAAQERGTAVTLTISPSFVSFDGYGGNFGALVARLSVTRDFTRSLGGEVSAFMLAPTGGATSIPGCIEGGACETRSTPNALSGVLTSMFAWAGESGFRLSAGVGAVGASGGEGFSNRSSLAGLVGIDFQPRSSNRFVPTFALRLVQLASPIAGARQLLLPGVGLTF